MELLQLDAFNKFSTTQEFIEYKKYILADDDITWIMPKKHTRSSSDQGNETNKNNNININDINFIIREPILSRSLLAYLKKTYCDENYYFLKDVINLESKTNENLLRYLFILFFKF